MLLFTKFFQIIELDLFILQNWLIFTSWSSLMIVCSLPDLMQNFNLLFVVHLVSDRFCKRSIFISMLK